MNVNLTDAPPGWLPINRHPMLVARQLPRAGWISHDLPHGDISPPHQHERGHLVYAASGILSVTTRRGRWICPANRAAWTPARVVHHHQAYGRTDMRIVFIAPSLARALPNRPAVLAVSALARESLLALTGDRPYRPATRTRLRHLLVEEVSTSSEQPLHLPEPEDDRLRALACLLRDNPADTAPLATLGHTVGASERTLSRLFRSELGMSFRQWRTQLRLHHALVLLSSGHSVTSTAHACGWSNPSTFIHAFTSAIGQTPGRYQHDLRHGAEGRPEDGRPAVKPP
ncbi:AraC family transcriptional regulator [Streptomyces sp. NPDC057555]|uniref:AraC family transcriptional regulator n=1 Tax=Streptomyces sp. NPDC057555 TaxID=3346166 RepID=UPI0036C6AD75